VQEIFDEVTEEQLHPAWSYDLNTVLSTLEAILLQCQEIALLEEKLTEVRHVSL
jgi:hypothetical protein